MKEVVVPLSVDTVALKVDVLIESEIVDLLNLTVRTRSFCRKPDYLADLGT